MQKLFVGRTSGQGDQNMISAALHDALSFPFLCPLWLWRHLCSCECAYPNIILTLLLPWSFCALSSCKFSRSQWELLVWSCMMSIANIRIWYLVTWILCWIALYNLDPWITMTPEPTDYTCSCSIDFSYIWIYRLLSISHIDDSLLLLRCWVLYMWPLSHVCPS